MALLKNPSGNVTKALRAIALAAALGGSLVFLPGCLGKAPVEPVSGEELLAKSKVAKG